MITNISVCKYCMFLETKYNTFKNGVCSFCIGDGIKSREEYLKMWPNKYEEHDEYHPCERCNFPIAINLKYCSEYCMIKNRSDEKKIQSIVLREQSSLKKLKYYNDVNFDKLTVIPEAVRMPQYLDEEGKLVEKEFPDYTTLQDIKDDDFWQTIKNTFNKEEYIMFKMRYEGYEYKEIGKKVNKSPQNVHQILHRLGKKIKSI